MIASTSAGSGLRTPISVRSHLINEARKSRSSWGVMCGGLHASNLRSVYVRIAEIEIGLDHRRRRLVGALRHRRRIAEQGQVRPAIDECAAPELKDAKPHYDTWNDAKRTIFAKGVIEQLREAWDQGVADFIFPVLGRFDNHIKGNSLYKLVVLTEEDVKTVTSARGRLSDGLHVSALNPESVSHTELVAEVAKIEDWLKSIQQRQRHAAGLWAACAHLRHPVP